MSMVVRLAFPILVEQRKSGFSISPLLIKGQVISRNRYGDAMRAMQRSVRNQFLQKQPEAELLDELLWYCFAPEIKFDLLQLALKSGLKYIEGLFAVAFYELNGQRYACLPKLNGMTVRISQDIKTRPLQITFITEKIAAFFRQQRKENETFDIESCLSQANDSITIIKASTEITRQIFPFEESGSSLFAFQFGNESMDGATELNKVGEDLTLRYPDALGTAFFRTNETQLLSRCLFGGKPQAVVVVGKVGIGKTNLIENTLKDYLDQNPQRSLTKSQKIWHVDPLRVISGMSVVGQWERRFESILERLKERMLQTTRKHRLPDVLYVDNPIALLRIGKSSQTSLTLSHLLKPYVERRDIPVVLEATAEEWQKIQEIDRGFSDLFQVIRLEALKPQELNKVYVHKRAQLEYQYQLRIGSKAMLTVLKSEPRFRGNAELPGNVISILEKLSVRNQKAVLNEQRIYESLESQFHIKKDMIDRNITLKRSDILAFFNQNLIGQAQACEVLTDTVLGIKAQITSPSKPLNTMLFIGPTGVGKTEAVKLLANYLFDRPECLVRIDMNEYVDDGSVDRLIGSQHHPQGILTEQVRYNGSCVLLLDEVEKAHPRVHDLLLQLLDDGRLTDALGNTTDFTQCVIVMTSNIGAQESSTEMGFAPQPLENASTYLKALEQFFRPEMINRINNIVVFDALQQDSMQFLARLHLSKLLQRDGFTRRKTILNVDEECLTTLANQSYNPRLGARALKRNLEKTITQLTGKLLSEITSSDPIILNVALADGQPVTTITQLMYQTVIQNLFQFDSDQVDLEEYRTLLLRLEDSDNALTTLTSLSSETNEKTQYAAWSLSGAIRDIKEPLQRFLWETEDRLKTSTIKGSFSLRSSRAIALSKWKDIKVDTAALFAHNDMRDYLHDLHKKSGEAFQEDLHSRLQLTGETQQLTFASKCLADRGIDQGTLLIMPLMTEGDTQQVDHLDRYVTSAVDAIGSIEHRNKDKSGVTLSISGCGIHELLEYESGVHLFIEHQSMQVPVLLHYLRSVDPDEIASAISTLRNQSELQVLRLYYRNDPTADMYHITDLRLGMSIEAPTTPADLNILLYPCYSTTNTKVNANKGTNACQ